MLLGWDMVNRNIVYRLDSTRYVSSTVPGKKSMMLIAGRQSEKFHDLNCSGVPNLRTYRL
jgi:hypothetical protein